MDESTSLSKHLLSTLHSKNIWFLFQIRATSRPDALPDSWINSITLGLNLDQSCEWKKLCLALTQLGIHLTNSADSPHWSRGDKSGQISAQNIYAATANSIWPNNISRWKNRFWAWRIPQKIKLFFWLLTENKINTWDNLLRKGWSGPNICCLCHHDSESVDHLFINCQFTK
jgi:hypothetical protein